MERYDGKTRRIIGQKHTSKPLISNLWYVEVETHHPPKNKAPLVLESPETNSQSTTL
jgi:hypothetical protein